MSGPVFMLYVPTFCYKQTDMCRPLPNLAPHTHTHTHVNYVHQTVLAAAQQLLFCCKQQSARHRLQQAITQRRCADPVWITAVHECSYILYHLQHVTLHCRWALAKGAMLVWWVFTRLLHRCEAAPTSKSSARLQLQYAQASTVYNTWHPH